MLAADAPRLHGLTPSLAIIDELHAHRDDDVYLALRTAALKRADSRLVVISTAGQGADSPLGRLRARALAQPSVMQRDGFTDARGPSLRMLEWALPEAASVGDVKAVKAVNPASWITEAALAEQRDAVPELAFRRFHANQWAERAGHWLPPGAWQACVGEPAFTPGEPIWVGVDVGGDKSASAVVWVNEAITSVARSSTGTRASSTASRRSGSSPPSTSCARSCTTRGGSARPRRSSRPSGSSSPRSRRQTPA